MHPLLLTLPLPLLACGVALLGLLAGSLGGLLGVGGSVIIIPGLVILLGQGLGGEQHAFQAAAMVANVAVAVPSMLRHRRAGTIDPAAVRAMAPAAAIGIVAGVALSNLPAFRGADGGKLLSRLLAGFLVWVIVVNVAKLKASTPQTSPQSPDDHDKPATGRGFTGRFAAVGAIMGTSAGLLGIGGGALAVPLQQQIINRPLRRAISNSATAMCVSAPLGAIYKNLSLGSHLSDDSVLPGGAAAGLLLGLLLAPTAWVGGRLGASLTHTLPLNLTRVVFILLMIVAAWKMAAL
ncbi:MAG: TSUP family transporter [Algisphaera sp.]